MEVVFEIKISYVNKIEHEGLSFESDVGAMPRRTSKSTQMFFIKKAAKHLLWNCFD